MAEKIPTKVQKDGTFGWAELQHMFDPERVTKELQKRFRVALMRIGEDFVRLANDTILDEKPFIENSPVTVALKGSSTPLFNDGDLTNAITYRVATWKRLRMGLNSAKAFPKAGKPRAVAEILHNGATIVVTDAMRRRLFAALRNKLGAARFRNFSAAFLKGPAKAVWVIPPRPFLDRVWKDKRWIRSRDKHLVEAFAAALSLEP